MQSLEIVLGLQSLMVGVVNSVLHGMVDVSSVKLLMVDGIVIVVVS